MIRLQKTSEDSLLTVSSLLVRLFFTISHNYLTIVK
jgi:hypothetical protein